MCDSEQMLAQLESTVIAEVDQLDPEPWTHATDILDTGAWTSPSVARRCMERLPRPRRSTPAYSIAETAGGPPHWHYFPDRLFHSKEYAAAFALREARWLIDW